MLTMGKLILWVLQNTNSPSRWSAYVTPEDKDGARLLSGDAGQIGPCSNSVFQFSKQMLEILVSSLTQTRGFVRAPRKQTQERNKILPIIARAAESTNAALNGDDFTEKVIVYSSLDPKSVPNG